MGDCKGNSNIKLAKKKIKLWRHFYCAKNKKKKTKGP